MRELYEKSYNNFDYEWKTWKPYNFLAKKYMIKTFQQKKKKEIYSFFLEEKRLEIIIKGRLSCDKLKVHYWGVDESFIHINRPLTCLVRL